jgi:transcription elongation factor GreA
MVLPDEGVLILLHNATQGEWSMALMNDTNAHGQRPLLTSEGRARLEAELKELVEVQRPRIADDIHEAKEAGDISESSAYEHAKNEQARIEGRIRELTELLNRAGTLELVTDAHVVRIGSTVTVRTESGKERTFTIVSTHEADPRRNYISNESPVGQALIDTKPGDKVKVQTPNGEVGYVIVSIS